MDIFQTLGSGSLSVTAMLIFLGKANTSIHGLRHVGEDDTARAYSRTDSGGWSKMKVSFSVGGHGRRNILMDSHPYSYETSIFTLGAPHEEVQSRQTKLHPVLPWVN